ncbi:CBS domain-containing protein [Thermodesulfobacteriota bacterium]
MRVKKLLEAKGSQVYTVSPDATVYDALKLMSEKEIGALVVVENGKLLGIFSERDYARKVILKGKNSQETLVKEIMTTNVLHASPKQKIRKCLSLMTKNHFRHLPIMEDDQLVGIISIEDVRRMG